MNKWHPNKIEIYIADLCLKSLCIPRDVRYCIKRYLFDKYCVTDEYVEKSKWEIKWSDSHVEMYALFRNYKVNFIQTIKLVGKTYFLKYLALSCLNAGLKVQLLTIDVSVRVNYSNFLSGFKAPIDNFITDQRYRKVNVVICDYYLQPKARRILKRNISDPNVHVMIVTSGEVPEEFKNDKRIKFTK